MKKIHLLPDHIISRIAAGEVIERPVFAVKELIENAIDAGATTISILIEESGLKKIVVSDNGEGIEKDDILIAFKPHTTSKLQEDLHSITTLGFRGEALASIAAISNLTIQSRTKDTASGFQVVINNGELEETGPIGIPEGTIVTVTNLFSSIPARKKFLKTQRTEFRHIVELVTSFALVYPETKFLLKHNKRIVLDLPEQTREERMQKLLGKSYAQHFMPLITEPGYISISGFIAHPQLTTKSTNKQFLFVNKRPVSDRLITTAVKEAYGTLLEATHMPLFLLFLEVPYETVDINIHPRKEQVSFVNQTLFFETVKSAVVKTLTENNLTFYNASFQSFSARSGSTATFASDFLKESVIPWSIKNEKNMLQIDSLYQLHNTYLMTQTPFGMVIIDQHAAHERILYEQFSLAFQKEKKKKYVLPQPLFIDLSLSDFDAIHEAKKTLQTIGFTFEPFKDAVKVTSVPLIFKDRDIPLTIQELLTAIDENSDITIDTLSQKMLSFLACRASVKAGERLTNEEAKKLVTKLERTENNATCPHGRPTKILIPLQNLHKMFKRE